MVDFDTKQTWYFTFGLGGPRRSNFYKVENATYDEAREQMIAAFGLAWAFQYSEADWNRDGESMAEKWSLTEIKR